MVPSYEDIQSLARDPRGTGAERNSSDSSEGSTGSLERATYGRASVDNSSFEEGSIRSASSFSVTDSHSELPQAQLKQKPSIVLDSVASSSSLDRGTSEILRQRRRQFQKMGETESDATFNSSTAKRPSKRRSSDSTVIGSHQGLVGKKNNSLSDHVEEEEEEEEWNDSEGGKDRVFSRRNNVDHTTGWSCDA